MRISKYASTQDASLTVNPLAVNFWDCPIPKLCIKKVRVNSRTMQMFLERIRRSLELGDDDRMVLIHSKSFSSLTVSFPLKLLSSSLVARLQMDHKLDRDRPNSLGFTGAEVEDVGRIQQERCVLHLGIGFGVSEMAGSSTPLPSRIPGANLRGHVPFTEMEHNYSPSRRLKRIGSMPSPKFMMESSRASTIPPEFLGSVAASAAPPVCFPLPMSSSVPSNAMVDRREKKSTKRLKKLRRRQRRQKVMEQKSSSEEDVRDASMHQLGCKALMMRPSTLFMSPTVDDATSSSFNGNDVSLSSPVVATASMLGRIEGDVEPLAAFAYVDTVAVERKGMVEGAIEKAETIEKGKKSEKLKSDKQLQPSLAASSLLDMQVRLGTTNGDNGDLSRRNEMTIKTGEMLSSTEDSGYPQSVAGSDRLQDSHSPTALMEEEILPPVSSPTELLSPILSTLLSVAEYEDRCCSSDSLFKKSVEPASCLGDMEEVSVNRQIGISGGNVTIGQDSFERKEGVVHGDGIIFPELDVLLSKNIEHKEMFEPGDLVLCDEAGERGRGGGEFDEVGYGMDDSTTDWLKLLEVPQVMVAGEEQVFKDTFADLEVSILCNSLLSKDGGAKESHSLGSSFYATGFDEDLSPAISVATTVTVGIEPIVEQVASESPVIRDKVKRPESSGPVRRTVGMPRTNESDGPVRRKVGRPRNGESGAPAKRKIGKPCKNENDGPSRKKARKLELGPNKRTRSGRAVTPTWKVVSGRSDSSGERVLETIDSGLPCDTNQVLKAKTDNRDSDLEAQWQSPFEHETFEAFMTLPLQALKPMMDSRETSQESRKNGEKGRLSESLQINHLRTGEQDNVGERVATMECGKIDEKDGGGERKVKVHVESGKDKDGMLMTTCNLRSLKGGTTSVIGLKRRGAGGTSMPLRSSTRVDNKCVDNKVGPCDSLWSLHAQGPRLKKPSLQLQRLYKGVVSESYVSQTLSSGSSGLCTDLTSGMHDDSSTHPEVNMVVMSGDDSCDFEFNIDEAISSMELGISSSVPNSNILPSLPNLTSLSSLTASTSLSSLTASTSLSSLTASTSLSSLTASTSLSSLTASTSLSSLTASTSLSSLTASTSLSSLTASTSLSSLTASTSLSSLTASTSLSSLTASTSLSSSTASTSLSSSTASTSLSSSTASTSLSSLTASTSLSSSTASTSLSSLTASTSHAPVPTSPRPSSFNACTSCTYNPTSTRSTYVPTNTRAKPTCITDNNGVKKAVVRVNGPKKVRLSKSQCSRETVLTDPVTYLSPSREAPTKTALTTTSSMKSKPLRTSQLGETSPWAEDEDYIDLHVREDDMFSDVEGEGLLDKILPKQRQTAGRCAAVKASVKDRLGQLGLNSKAATPSHLHEITPTISQYPTSSAPLISPSNRSSAPIQERIHPLPQPHSSNTNNEHKHSPGTPFEGCYTRRDVGSNHSGSVVSKNAVKKQLGPKAPLLHSPSTLAPSSPLVHHFLPPQSEEEVKSISLTGSHIPSSNVPPGKYVPAPPMSGVPGKMCFNFLKGSCLYGSQCRFNHLDITVVPLDILESSVLNLSQKLIPRNIVYRYANDQHSAIQLKLYFDRFCTMIRHLLNNNLAGVTTAWEFLMRVANIKFKVPLLCRLLGLFAGSPTHLNKARVVVSGLLETSYVLSHEDYFHLFWILGQHQMIEAFKKVYLDMKCKRLYPDLPTISAMLRSIKDLGEWVFQLLADIKLGETYDRQEMFRLASQMLDTVDYNVLAKTASLQRVKDFLHSTPYFAATLNLDIIVKLSAALTACSMWTTLISLFHHSLRLPNIICESLELAIKHVCISEKVVNIIGRLCDDQKARLSSVVWNKVMLCLAENGKSQEATEFYATITKLSKQLSSEVMVALIQLFITKHDPCMAMTLLTDGLQHTPPVLPPLPLLTAVVSSGGMVNSTQDIYPVISTLIQNHCPPPPMLLNIFLLLVSKEKCYSKLTEVVKMSTECGVIMDKPFYQKAMSELSQWGNDQEAVAMLSAVARVVVMDGEELGGMEEEGAADTEVTSLRERSNSSLPDYGTLALSADGFMDSTCKFVMPFQPLSPMSSVGESSAASLPPDSSELPGSQLQRGQDQADVTPGCITPPGCFTSPNLHYRELEKVAAMEQQAKACQDKACQDRVCQDRACQDTPPELLQLILNNGKMGQLRAVASILVDRESTASWYDEPLLLSIWEVLTNSIIRKTSSTFSSFLTHLDQSRSTLRPANGAKRDHQHLGLSLLPSDRWVASQLGIALLRLHEQDEDWKAGFSILQHLHSFSLHYVKLSQPPSTLPPLLPSPPSPCCVALTAVNICLHVDQGLGSAMEVLRCPDWVGTTCMAELCRKTEMITTMAQKCLSVGALKDAGTCLDSVTSSKLVENFVPLVTDLHNELLHVVLEARDMQFALRVYGAMRRVKLQCFPSVFSCLLQALCDADQCLEARELCEQAIADCCYAPLYNMDPYEATLPASLTRLETHLLLEDHLTKLPLEARADGNRNLVLHLSVGSRDILKAALASDINPPLSVTFANKYATISTNSLQQWFSSHPVTSKDSVFNLSESTEVLKRKRLIVTPPVASQQLMNAQKEAVCQEFVSNMKHYSKTKFKEKSDYTHLLRVLSISYFKTSQTFMIACRDSTSLGVRLKWVVPQEVKDEVHQIVSNILSKFSVYAKDMDKELGLCWPSCSMLN